MPESDVINRAIASHAMWKHELARAIETGSSQWTPHQVGLPDQCEFGQWLEALPASEKASEHYQQVKHLHEMFHQAVADILEMALAGRKEEAKEATALRSHFGILSSKLTVAMSQWKRA